jgi:hypothetical protein
MIKIKAEEKMIEYVDGLKQNIDTDRQRIINPVEENQL